MKKTMKILTFFVLLAFLVSGAVSCKSGGVSQAEYDSLKNKLNDTESQLKTVQEKLAVPAGADAQYNNLNNKYTELQAQNNANLNQIKSLQGQAQALQSQNDALAKDKQAADAKYNELNAAYTDLQKKYQAAIAPPAPLTVDSVEQAIFQLVNQERTGRSLPPLQWGNVLHGQAQQNSAHMAETGKFEYSEYSYFQQLFMAAAYSNVDALAKGALLIWKNNQYQFEHGILSTAFKYCSVGAYKSGDVFYITFMASDFP